MVFRQVNDRRNPPVGLSLAELLVEEVTAEIEHSSEGDSHGTKAELLQGQPELPFRCAEPLVDDVIDIFSSRGIQNLGIVSFKNPDEILIGMNVCC